MNRKKTFAQLAYLLIGTFLVVTIGTVVTVNFFRDSRVINGAGKPAEVRSNAAGTQVEDTTAEAVEVTASDGTKTVEYKRAATAVNTPAQTPKPTQAASPTPTVAPKATEQPHYKIVVINTTGKKSVGQEVVETLASAGYLVAEGSMATTKAMATEITDRTGAGGGDAVRKLLRAGKLVKQEADPTNAYDITVILGEDYIP